jgi:iron complex transport system substrate-binding protein
MQKNHIYIIASIAIVAIILAAAVIYYNNNTKDDNDNNVPPISTPTATVEGSPEPEVLFPVTITDDDGTKVTIESIPQRIVSLAPSNTELLFAVNAGKQVIGVTDYCDYPYNFAEWVTYGNMSTIGGYWQPAIEPIIALNPDLVIANGGGPSDQAAANLRSMGYTVIVLNPKTIDDVLNNLDIVGKATGHTNEATTLISSLQARINAVASKVAGITDKPTVYMEVSDDPLMAVGPGGFIDDLITLAGGTNIFSDAATAYPIVSSDVIIAKNPDIILSPFSNVVGRPGWSTINAVANNQIYNRGSDNIYVRGGPRLVDALEELSKTLHPEIFGAT